MDYHKINDSLNDVRNKETKSRYKFFVTVLILLFLIVLVVYLNVYVFINIEVNGTSMEPTLYGGDNLIAVKGASINRGDIVIIDKSVSEEETDKYYIIKRAIAFEGETIELKSDGYVCAVYINGEKLNEPYLPKNTTTEGKDFLPTNTPYTLQKDEIFYLGDNRDVSLDARQVGPCKKSAVIAVVMNWTVKHKKAITDVFNFFRSVTNWFSSAFGCGGNKS